MSSRSDAVIGWAAKLLPQSLFVMYEQIRPRDPFGRIMQDHFLKLNSTLHALQQYPDSAAQRHRFLVKVSMLTIEAVEYFFLRHVIVVIRVCVILFLLCSNTQ